MTESRFSVVDINIESKKINLSDNIKQNLLDLHYNTIVKNKIINNDNKVDCLAFIIFNRTKKFVCKLINYKMFNINDVIECIYKYPACILYLPKTIIDDENVKEKLTTDFSYLDKIYPEYYDYLPNYLTNLDIVKQKCNRIVKSPKKETYNLEWLDKDGNIINFFTLKNNFPIKSKADYYKLYNLYVDKKLPVAKFCELYGIESIEGFNKLIKKIIDEIYKNKKKNAKNYTNETYEIGKDIVIKILNNEIKLEEFIANFEKNYPFANIEVCFKMLSDKEKENFALKINEYLSNKQILISSNFISFLTIQNKSISETYTVFIRRSINFATNKEVIGQVMKNIDCIKAFEKKYATRNNLYCKYMDVNGNQYIVDDDVIDQAYAYLKDNNLYICYKSMQYLCREIAYKRLDYSEELRNHRNHMMHDIAVMISEELDIEYYIKMMERENESINLSLKI